MVNYFKILIKGDVVREWVLGMFLLGVLKIGCIGRYNFRVYIRDR